MLNSASGVSKIKNFTVSEISNLKVIGNFKILQ